jgi:hypothetical protein
LKSWKQTLSLVSFSSLSILSLFCEKFLFKSFSFDTRYVMFLKSRAVQRITEDVLPFQLQPLWIWLMGAEAGVPEVNIIEYPLFHAVGD